jgi:hypothetical protein
MHLINSEIARTRFLKKQQVPGNDLENVLMDSSKKNSLFKKSAPKFTVSIMKFHELRLHSAELDRTPAIYVSSNKTAASFQKVYI